MVVDFNSKNFIADVDADVKKAQAKNDGVYKLDETVYARLIELMTVMSEFVNEQNSRPDGAHGFNLRINAVHTYPQKKHGFVFMQLHHLELENKALVQQLEKMFSLSDGFRAEQGGGSTLMFCFRVSNLWTPIG
ncbi:MAG: hypothetical protein LIO58_00255 [Oscillospiraceae bacterium]|nr:hypothetical protein [Oscillospiraceae bacterium]